MSVNQVNLSTSIHFPKRFHFWIITHCLALCNKDLEMQELHESGLAEKVTVIAFCLTDKDLCVCICLT